MTAIINGDSPSITFSDATTQATSAVVSGKVPYSILPTGSVLQVVQGTLTSSISTSSSSFVTTGLSATITPKFSTSKILAMVSSGADNQASNGQLTVNLYRGGTGLSGNGGFGVLYSGTARVQGFVSVVYLDSPATTSSTTYALYFASTNGGTVTFNNPNASVAQTGLITLMEIAG